MSEACPPIGLSAARVSGETEGEQVPVGLCEGEEEAGAREVSGDRLSVSLVWRELQPRLCHQGAGAICSLGSASPRPHPLPGPVLLSRQSHHRALTQQGGPAFPTAPGPGTSAGNQGGCCGCSCHPHWGSRHWPSHNRPLRAAVNDGEPFLQMEALIKIFECLPYSSFFVLFLYVTEKILPNSLPAGLVNI